MTTNHHDEDEALDRLLARATMPPVSPALERRVLADYDRIAARWTLTRLLDRLADAVWPDAPVWQPACAMAAAIVIGLGVAAFAPLDAAAPQDENQTFADSSLSLDI